MKNKTILSLVGLSSMIFFTGCFGEKVEMIQVPKKTVIKTKKVKEPSFFEIKRKKELSKVISQQNIPIKTADKVMRVLIFPYVDENDIYQNENFHFITVEKGKWVFAEYPADPKTSVKEFTPLKVKE